MTPRERAVDALSLVGSAPGGAEAAAATALASGASDRLLDLDHDAALGVEPLLVGLRPAAEDRIGDAVDRRARRELRLELPGSTFLSTGRKPHSAQIRCAVRVFVKRMNWFALSLFSLVLITAIGVSISIVCLGIVNWMSWPFLRESERLVLVGEQHVALAGEERVRRVAAGLRLHDDVLEQLQHVRLRLLVGLAELPLRAVGGEDVPLRRARRERVRR